MGRTGLIGPMVNPRGVFYAGTRTKAAMLAAPKAAAPSTGADDSVHLTKSSSLYIFRSGPAERISVFVALIWWKNQGDPHGSQSSP